MVRDTCIAKTWDLSEDGEQIMMTRLNKTGMNGVRNLAPPDLRKKLGKGDGRQLESASRRHQSGSSWRG